jgi:guanine deaminase
MNNEEKIMTELIEYAYERMLSNNAYPFCAFVVKNSIVISRGFNNVMSSWRDKTNHGEMVAIRKAMRALQQSQMGTEYELYSTCQPCLACLDTALFLKFGKLVYSVSQQDYPAYFHDHKYSFTDYVKDVNDKVKVVGGVLRDEGLNLFKVAKRKYGW